MIKKPAMLALVLMVPVAAWSADPPKDDKAGKDGKRPWPPQKVPKVIDNSAPERVGRKTQAERAKEAGEKPKAGDKKK